MPVLPLVEPAPIFWPVGPVPKLPLGEPLVEPDILPGMLVAAVPLVEPLPFMVPEVPESVPVIPPVVLPPLVPSTLPVAEPLVVLWARLRVECRARVARVDRPLVEELLADGLLCVEVPVPLVVPLEPLVLPVEPAEPEVPPPVCARARVGIARAATAAKMRMRI